MKNVFITLLLSAAFILTVLPGIQPFGTGSENAVFVSGKQKIDYQTKMKKRAVRNQGRDEYFFRLTRDPATNALPENVRSREIAHARQIPEADAFRKSTNGFAFDWVHAGPNKVGGRTRALAVDLSDSTGNTVLAGGVSGGIWKSTDRGDSWELITSPDQNLSVTSLAQDPNNTDIWYYASGERRGNSAGGKFYATVYYGNGIWKSTDGGDTWFNLTEDQSGIGDASWNSAFDMVSRIIVNPVTSSVFAATNGFGIFRSTDGENFERVLGEFGENYFSEIAADVNGNLVAVLSARDAGQTPDSVGIFYSVDDGETWEDRTPESFPSYHQRSVLTISESYPEIIYVWSYLGGSTDGFENQSLFKLNLLSDSATVLTDNIPKIEGNSFRGSVNSQGNYNMTIAVHPEDTNLVYLGGVSMFRSKDGFATNGSFSWVGGYYEDGGLYPNHHPDNHFLVFDPFDSDRLWSAHDGGISLNNNSKISRTWVNKDNGYNVTQFYTVAISNQAGDDRIVGGTQDNGSPYFRLNDPVQRENDISSGDGSFAYIGGNYMFVSSQRGNVLKVGYFPDSEEPANPWEDNDKGEDGERYYDAVYVHPEEAEDQLFVHPFEINPTNENVMFYPDGSRLYRNAQINLIGIDPFADGWEQLSEAEITETGYTITALAASEQNPSDRLYFAASHNGQKPKVLMLDNATNNDEAPVDISIPDAPAGSNVIDIAINPEDADEAIVVMSNYNVKGIFHTYDAGANWTMIEGNLQGDDLNIGPSVRAAAIIPRGEETTYVVGTSTGVYSAIALDGEFTEWYKEARQVVGSSVAEHFDYRHSDMTLAVGTHGRGIFAGKAKTTVSSEDEPVLPTAFELNQNYPNPFNPSTKISFTLPEMSEVSLRVYDINGRLVSTLSDNEMYRHGSHTLSFDAGNLASGMYLYRIAAKGLYTNKVYSKSQRMTLIK